MEPEDYSDALVKLAQALVINSDNPIITDVVSISVIDCGDIEPWFNIRFHDKELRIDNFKDMHTLWTTLKNISEKTEALYTDYIWHREALSTEKEKD